ncbi:hypothetical protein Tco_0851711 [Tanacetum coccineum]
MWEDLLSPSTPSRRQRKCTTPLGKKKATLILIQVSGSKVFSSFSARDGNEKFWDDITIELIMNVIREAITMRPIWKKLQSNSTEKKRKPVSESSEAHQLAKRAKAGNVVKKRTVTSSKQLVDEFVDEGVPAANQALMTQMEELLRTVSGKGKEKVGEEQAAQVLLNLQTPKKKSSTEQYIFQRRSLIPTETAGREDLFLIMRTWFICSDTAWKGQAGQRPCTRDEGPGWSRPLVQEIEGWMDQTLMIVAESLPSPTPCVLAGPNLEHSDVEITDPSSQPQPEHMDEGFTASAYPDVQENLKLTVDEQPLVINSYMTNRLRPICEDNSRHEAESMVSVTIQQDTSIIPPMTSPVIDLVTRPDSPNVHWPLPTTTTTTAAPKQQQQLFTTTSPQHVHHDSIIISAIKNIRRNSNTTIAGLVEKIKPRDKARTMKEPNPLDGKLWTDQNDQRADGGVY